MLPNASQTFMIPNIKLPIVLVYSVKTLYSESTNQFLTMCPPTWSITIEITAIVLTTAPDIPWLLYSTLSFNFIIPYFPFLTLSKLLCRYFFCGVVSFLSIHISSLHKLEYSFSFPCIFCASSDSNFFDITRLNQNIQYTYCFIFAPINLFSNFTTAIQNFSIKQF